MLGFDAIAENPIAGEVSSVFTILLDGATPVAWLGNGTIILLDGSSPLIFTGNLRTDVSAAVKWAQTIFRLNTVPLIYATTMQMSADAALLWRGTLQSTGETPLAWLGKTEIVGQSAAPLAWQSVLIGDGAVPLASDTSVGTTLSAPLQWLGHTTVLVADGGTPLAWQIRPRTVTVVFDLG